MEYQLQRLVEQEIGRDIPKEMEIFCYYCRKKTPGKLRGVSGNLDLMIINYDCTICRDTMSIKPEELKSKLLTLAA